MSEQGENQDRADHEAMVRDVARTLECDEALLASLKAVLSACVVQAGLKNLPPAAVVASMASLMGVGVRHSATQEEYMMLVDMMYSLRLDLHDKGLAKRVLIVNGQETTSKPGDAN